MGETVIVPMLVCRNGAAEIEFCKKAFHAVEMSRRVNNSGTVVHATLAIGSALLMIHGEFDNLASRAPQADGSSPVVVYLYVEDADATVEQAQAAGARLLIPVTTHPWGDRTGRILDPSGHVWNISTRLSNPAG
jgi:PhnB protein